MFAEALDNILRDHCTPAVVRAIEAGGSPDALWGAIEGAGFLELLADEAAGGAALPLPELFPILVSLGRYALPLPVGQTMLARALCGAQHAVPQGKISFAPSARPQAGGGLHCPLVPFGWVADVVMVDVQGDLLVLPCAGVQRERSGIHHSLAASLTFSATVCEAAVRLPNAGHRLSCLGAALYAALLSGAMGRVFELTLNYCNDRVQFGKAIGKFQAVQHQLAEMAEHLAAATMAAEMAWNTDARLPSLLCSAIAKARTSEAAVLVAATGHALHGAIGVTEEYDLQLYTRRLHEGRLAHGSEAFWNIEVGRALLRSDAPSVVDFVRTVQADGLAAGASH